MIKLIMTLKMTLESRKDLKKRLIKFYEKYQKIINHIEC